MNGTVSALGRVLALSVVSAVLSQSPAEAAFDHLQCFKIKSGTPAAKYSADISPNDPAFSAVPPGCTITVPAKLLCVDAEKTNVTPAPPGAADASPTQPFFCYKAKCSKTQPSGSLTDQFGTHSFQVKTTKLVCAPVSPPCLDADSDGVTTCANDCNDEDPSINPGVIEACDGRDDDCDGVVDNGCSPPCLDADLDGFTTCENDCDDGDPSTNPGAPEICDGNDNDCDGVADNGTLGSGINCNTGDLGVCETGTTQCVSAAIACVPNNTPTLEACGDTQDNDCDGVVDNGCAGASCTVNGDCMSGFCTDGVCCVSACGGLCQGCSAVLTGEPDGVCISIPVDTDPQDECAGPDVCDGSGGCMFPN